MRAAMVALVITACVGCGPAGSATDGTTGGTAEDVDGAVAEPAQLRDLPIVTAPIPGTEQDRLDVADDGSVTRLLRVTGEWNQVSADLAKVVRAHGWSIESIRCVGSGNDVIGRRQVRDRWILLESGAGERGAGIILRVAPEQRAPRGDVSVDGPCPEVLRAAVR